MCLCAWKHKAAGDTDRVPRSPVFKELKWLVCYHYHSKRDFPIPSRQRWHVSGRRPADCRAGKPLQSFFSDFSPSLVLFFWGGRGAPASIVRARGERGDSEVTVKVAAQVPWRHGIFRREGNFLKTRTAIKKNNFRSRRLRFDTVVLFSINVLRLHSPVLFMSTSTLDTFS